MDAFLERRACWSARHLNLPLKRLFVIGRFVLRRFLATLALLFLPLSAVASAAVVSPEVQSGLDYLLDDARPKSGRLSKERIAPLMAFVSRAMPGENWALAERNGNSAGLRVYELAMSMDRFLAYRSLVDVPGAVFAPSSVGWIRWIPHPDSPHTMDQIAVLSSRELTMPVAVVGTEVVKTTPDETTGGYYTTSSDAHTYVGTWNGKKTWVGITMQAGESTFGKKGVVIGADSDWTYYFSEKAGLTVGGLGWVKSKVYDSAGIAIYQEVAPGSGRIRCLFFKWIRAGWSGVNMAKTDHITSGQDRFFKGMEAVLTAERLPDPSLLSVVMKRFRSIPVGLMRDAVTGYWNRIETMSEGLARTRGKKLFLKRMPPPTDRDWLESYLAVAWIRDVVRGRVVDPLVFCKTLSQG